MHSRCQFCSSSAYYESIGLCSSAECRKHFTLLNKERNQRALQDLRVAAIRFDSTVGTTTNSIAEDCYTHYELLVALNKDEISDPLAAIEWARRLEISLPNYATPAHLINSHLIASRKIEECNWSKVISISC